MHFNLQFMLEFHTCYGQKQQMLCVWMKLDKEKEKEREAEEKIDQLNFCVHFGIDVLTSAFITN